MYMGDGLRKMLYSPPYSNNKQGTVEREIAGNRRTRRRKRRRKKKKTEERGRINQKGVIPENAGRFICSHGFLPSSNYLDDIS